ncbi:MAG: glutathione S-transferase N-terminal domain-containing protein [Pseudomonadota bacterium]
MPNPVLHQGAVLGSVLASSIGLWRGSTVVKAVAQPALPLVLYDMEASPYCRAVREVLTALHLDVEIRPCPKGGTRFRPEAERLGGKQQFPLLVDHNTGTLMYESADINAYLFRTYAGRDVPAYYRATPVKPLFSTLASGVRLARGHRVRPSKAPEQPLHLWSFESSPYSRLVRERLTELEIPYTLHNLGKEHWKEAGPAVRRIVPNPYVPREGGKRHAFWQRHRWVQVPYLDDPNTGAGLFESAAIIDYLETTYAL